MILSEEEIKEANSYLEQEREKGNIQNKPRRSKRNPLLAGVFFIPGVGQAVITAAGVIVVGGVIVSGTSLLGQRITDWIKFKKNTQPNIPKEMKNGENSIDLSKFSKDGKTAKGKNGQGGPYKYNKDGKWILEKDTARHGGRVWKLKFNNNRIKSIGKDGEILND